MMPMDEKPWQLQLVRRSLKKREKLRLLDKHWDVDPDSLILDLGCAQGILSYFLRRRGGRWVSVDLDLENLKTTQSLLKTGLLQVGTEILPFKDRSFDKVVSLDYLEHLDDDDLCLREIHRILKRGGELLMATPRTGRVFALHKLRNILGMKLEFYGHKREGYTLKGLRTKFVNSRFEYIKHKSFSRFFAEFLELILNFIYIKFFSSDEKPGLRDGHIRPTTAEEFSSRKKAFRLYSYIYPLVWLLSRLDNLLFFQRGYGLMIWAKKVD
jgi:SAM-dependent methyltransferase